MKQFIINQNDSGQRLDKFITKAVPKLPRSLMYKYIRLKRIKLNGKRCDISQMLNANDIIDMYINDEFFESANEKTSVRISSQEKIPPIVYEDNNIMIIFKPKGIDVHQGAEKPDETLIDMITAYLYKKGEYSPDTESSFSPAVCNRLDRNTAGLVIAAKNAASLREMNRIIKQRLIKKEYLCICGGKLAENSAVAEAYHRKGNHNKVNISLTPESDSKKIITKYEMLKKRNDLMLIKVELLTGRTHQIRAHLAFLGAPILGDGKYGSVKLNKKYKVFRQQLCAYSITFENEPAGILGYLSKKTFNAPKNDFEINL